MSNQDQQFFINKAIEHFKRKNFDKAQLILKKILKVQPKNYFVLNFFGLLLAIKNNFQLAINYYDKAIQENPKFIDAWFNKGNALYSIKNFTEAIICYDHTIQLNPKYSEAWFNKGNTLQELGRYDESINHFDHAIQLNPKYSEAWFNKGYLLNELKIFDEALKHYDQAIILQKDFAQAWMNKGNTLQELRKFDEALIHYEHAIKLKPNYAEAWSNKAICLESFEKYDEAKYCYDQAIKLKPDYAEAWSNKGALLHELQQFEEALQHYDRAIKLNPNYYKAIVNKGHTKLLLGNFEEGWDLFSKRWKKKKFQNYRHSNYNELQSLKDIKNKKVLVWHEQGLGDVIQFSRYISQLIRLEANVTFEVQEDLVNFFQSHLNCNVLSSINKLVDFDFQIPLLQLPNLFKTNDKNIPPLSKININSEVIISKREILNISNTKKNIGIAVSGNPSHKQDHKRSMPLSYFKSLLHLGNFFLIQKEISKFDMEFLNENKSIHFVGEHIKNFIDTASIVENMDLIISVDTSLIHLAGSLNKKSFLMLAWCPDWRWLLNNSNTPWYPSVKIFRQSSLGNWNSVINQIEFELKKNEQ